MSRARSRPAPTKDGEGSGPSREARRAVEQFFSAGLAGNEILDVFAMAGDARPEISVLSDDFLDDVARRLTRPELQVALMKKLLSGEIRTRLVGNRVQHKRLLRPHRYTAPQGGGLDEAADRVFQQARALYQRWPEVEGEFRR